MLGKKYFLLLRNDGYSNKIILAWSARKVTETCVSKTSDLKNVRLGGSEAEGTTVWGHKRSN